MSDIRHVIFSFFDSSPLKVAIIWNIHITVYPCISLLYWKHRLFPFQHNFVVNISWKGCNQVLNYLWHLLSNIECGCIPKILKQACCSVNVQRKTSFMLWGLQFVRGWNLHSWTKYDQINLFFIVKLLSKLSMWWTASKKAHLFARIMVQSYGNQEICTQRR